MEENLLIVNLCYICKSFTRIYSGWSWSRKMLRHHSSPAWYQIINRCASKALKCLLLVGITAQVCMCVQSGDHVPALTLLLSLVAMSSIRRHATAHSRTAGESTHWELCCHLCPVHGAWQHKRLHALYLRGENAAERTSMCLIDFMVNTNTNSQAHLSFLSPSLSPFHPPFLAPSLLLFSPALSHLLSSRSSSLPASLTPLSLPPSISPSLFSSLPYSVVLVKRLHF